MHVTKNITNYVSRFPYYEYPTENGDFVCNSHIWYIEKQKQTISWIYLWNIYCEYIYTPTEDR